MFVIWYNLIDMGEIGYKSFLFLKEMVFFFYLGVVGLGRISRVVVSFRLLV